MVIAPVLPVSVVVSGLAAGARDAVHDHRTTLVCVELTLCSQQQEHRTLLGPQR